MKFIWNSSKPSLLPVAIHVRRHLLGAALAGGSVPTRGGTSGDAAEVYPEAHPGAGHVLPLYFGAHVAQVGLVVDQVRQHCRRWRPDFSEPGRTAQRCVAGPADPYRWVGLLDRLGIDVHLVEGKEPPVEGSGARLPTRSSTGSGIRWCAPRAAGRARPARHIRLRSILLPPRRWPVLRTSGPVWRTSWRSRWGCGRA